MKNDYFNSAFILGGTSTIAKKICIKLAENGCKKFHLVCRNPDANKEFTQKLKSYYGAEVSEATNDLLLNNSLSNFLKLNTEQQRASPKARDMVVEVVGIIFNLSAST